MLPKLPNVNRNARPKCPSKLHPRPSLRFTPTAWAKLLYLRDLGPTEVGGFGISSQDDLLLVRDVVLVSQHTTAVTVKFEDAAVAEFFDHQIDLGRTPSEFGRIWIHTHPGDSPQPSATDEETFERVFSRSDWSVMAIVARGGATYARLQFTAGPGGEVRIPVRVAYGAEFGGTDFAAWQAEYARHVMEDTLGLPAWHDDWFSELPETALVDEMNAWPDPVRPGERVRLPVDATVL